jgi:molybdate transport system regulatory protein
MKNLSVQARLFILSGSSQEEGSFGKGVAALLSGIDNTGSLYAAAKELKMAYSKAWRLLNEAEANVGFLLINRDGARGSTLTPEGRKLLAAYEKLTEELADFTDRRFRELVS